MNRTVPVGLLVLCLLMLEASPVVAGSAGMAGAGPAPSDTTDSGTGSTIVLPILYYTPETRLAAGVVLQRLFRVGGNGEGRPSTMVPVVIATQNRQIVLQLINSLYLDGDRWLILANLQYVKYPSTFWGVGRDAPDDAEEDFTRRFSSIQVEALRRFGAALRVGVRAEHEPSRITATEAGGLLEGGSLTGSGKGTLSGLGLVVEWDTRDNIFGPWSGGYYRLSTMGFGEGLGSTWSFSEVSLDMRRYLNTGGGRVLATQIALWETAGSVPFFRLATLGGPILLRGYYEGRFRDGAGALAQVEYRVPLKPKLGLAGFAGLGDVAGRLADLDPSRARVSWGAGLRWFINPEERQGLRFDFGFGEGTSGFYVTFGEAF